MGGGAGAEIFLPLGLSSILITNKSYFCTRPRLRAAPLKSMSVVTCSATEEHLSFVTCSATKEHVFCYVQRHNGAMRYACQKNDFFKVENVARPNFGGNYLVRAVGGGGLKVANAKRRGQSQHRSTMTEAAHSISVPASFPSETERTPEMVRTASSGHL